MNLSAKCSIRLTNIGGNSHTSIVTIQKIKRGPLKASRTLFGRKRAGTVALGRCRRDTIPSAPPRFAQAQGVTARLGEASEATAPSASASRPGTGRRRGAGRARGKRRSGRPRRGRMPGRTSNAGAATAWQWARRRASDAVVLSAVSTGAPAPRSAGVTTAVPTQNFASRVWKAAVLARRKWSVRIRNQDRRTPRIAQLGTGYRSHQV